MSGKKAQPDNEDGKDGEDDTEVPDLGPQVFLQVLVRGIIRQLLEVCPLRGREARVVDWIIGCRHRHDDDGDGDGDGSSSSSSGGGGGGGDDLTTLGKWEGWEGEDIQRRMI